MSGAFQLEPANKKKPSCWNRTASVSDVAIPHQGYSGINTFSLPDFRLEIKWAYKRKFITMTEIKVDVTSIPPAKQWQLARGCLELYHTILKMPGGREMLEEEKARWSKEQEGRQ